jgi:hypothetical protein
MNRVPIFDIPVFHHQCKHHEKIKEFTDSVWKTIEDKKLEPHTDPTNVELKIWSDYFPEEVVPGLPRTPRDIQDLYLKDLEEFLEFAGYFVSEDKWIVSNQAWYNMGKKGCAQEEHDHPGFCTTWSAIHYVKFNPQEHASTEFINPINKLFWDRSWQSGNPFQPPYEWRRSSGYINVQEGDIIIFPSWLRHRSPYQTSDNLRVTMAMNFTILPADGLEPDHAKTLELNYP